MREVGRKEMYKDRNKKGCTVKSGLVEIFFFCFSCPIRTGEKKGSGTPACFWCGERAFVFCCCCGRRLSWGKGRAKVGIKTTIEERGRRGKERARDKLKGQAIEKEGEEGEKQKERRVGDQKEEREGRE